MSLKRLTDFLCLEELDPDNVEKTMPEHSESVDSKFVIEMNLNLVSVYVPLK